MYCYECMKAGTESNAVAICPNCNAGLCLLHLREAAATPGPGGTRLACRHDTWATPPVARSSSRRGSVPPSSP